MNILGISAFYHDSAAAIVIDGKIEAAAQEERFSRKKQDAGFPLHAIEFCLDHSGLAISDLDYIVFYEKPLLHFERLLETYYHFAPKGFKSFYTSIPTWVNEKLFLKKAMRDELKKMGKIDTKKTKFLFPEHHLSHASSAFFPSPFQEAAILTIDGVGEWATASICMGKGNQIEMLRELRFPHSVGLLYSAFTYYLGFRVNSGEYKLMGLAPYGNPGSERVKNYIDLIKNHILEIQSDGSVWLNMDYFNYATGLTMIKDKKWQQLFNMERRLPESELLQEHCDLAYAIQVVTEEIMLQMAGEVKKLTGASKLCLAGGVALNCVANGALLRSGLFEDIFIQPAAGDAGGAVGAALAAYYIYAKNERQADGSHDAMSGSYLGPAFSDIDIEKVAKKYRAVYTNYESFDDLSRLTAELIAEGNVVGWFQGRMEFGPRALGNRSILGDARNSEMQLKLNLKIKYREGFRPFAPAVNMDSVGDFFELQYPSPYMLLIDYVNKERRIDLPENYHELPLKEKLYFLRSDIPSVTHLDYSARLQTVHKETNERFWKLIDAFKKISGYGVIVNTSFNVRGEPIVCTPEDAYRCFMSTEMDYLVMNNFLFDKNHQTYAKEKIREKESFALD